MAGFGVVDQAAASVQTIEEYIKVGMVIANEVAQDFLECNKEEAEKDISEFKKIMIEFVKLEQEIKDIQQSVEYVKQTDENVNLEETFSTKLDELMSNRDESLILQHEKIQEFDQHVQAILNTDEESTPMEQGNTVTATVDNDLDIEMTQEINTKCPYTGMEMVNPVTNKHCGHNYDRDGILQYIKQRKKKAKCPLGGCSNEKPIEPSDLEENKELKRHIDRLNRNARKGRK